MESCLPEPVYQSGTKQDDRPNTTIKTLGGTATGSTPIALGVLYYKAHRFKANAFDNGDVTITNGKITNVSGRNPLEQLTVFVACPLADKITASQVQLVFNTGNLYSNQNATILSVEIDADNGLGFQPVTAGTPFTITWAVPGIKQVSTRISFSTGETLTSTASVPVDFGTAIYANPADTVIAINPTALHSGGTLSISYGCGSNEQITRPLLIVEGFDPLINGQESNNYGTFRGKLTRRLDGLTSLGDILEDNGYDYIYLNYNNGTDDINRNAALLSDAINWINQQKASAGSNEKNVVLGESMGGLVARIALRNMEIAGEDHQTDKYISLDTPHNGANVPLGVQYMLSHANTLVACVRFGFLISYTYCFPLRDFFPDLQNGLNILNSYAARQMLIYRADGPFISSSFYNSFQAQLASLGMPQKTSENIAITNGSIDAVKYEGFSAGANLINITATKNDIINYEYSDSKRGVRGFLRFFTSLFGMYGNAQFVVNALPDQNSSSNLIYYGRVYFRMGDQTIIWSNIAVTAQGHLPLDNAPGGLYNIQPIIGDMADLPPYVLSGIKTNAFSFVPSPSSSALLNSDKLNTGLNIRSSNVTNTGKSAMATLNGPVYTSYAADVNNEDHTDISIGGANFLAYLLAGDQGLTGNTSTLTNNSFNYGRNASYSTTSRIVRNIVVGSGGKLGINAALGLGFLSDGRALPTSGSTLNAYLAPGCNLTSPVIEVRNGGQLLLGDLGSGTKGNLSIKTGCTLRLKSGSTLQINNSVLTIEPGASILIEPGCTIQLNGSAALLLVNGTPVSTNTTGTITVTGEGLLNSPGLELFNNQVLKIGDHATVQLRDQFTCHELAKLTLNGENAVIELNGKMNLTAGTRFSITADQGVVPGFIRLKLRNPDFLTAATSGSFVLDGINNADKLLEITGGANFDKATGLTYLHFLTGNIVFTKNYSSLSTNLPGIIRTMSFTGTGGQGSINTYGQSSLILQDLKFENVDLSASMINGQAPLTVTTATFSNSTIETLYKSVNLNKISLDYASMIVHNATDVTGYITNLNTTTQEYIEVQSTPNFRFNNFLAVDPINPLYLDGTATKYLKCSNLRSTGETGTNDRSGHLIDVWMGKLEMGNQLWAGGNYLESNSTETYGNWLISLSHLPYGELSLKNGHNALLSNSTESYGVISGRVFVNRNCSGLGHTYDNPIDFAGNQWFKNAPLQKPSFTTYPRFETDIYCQDLAKPKGFIQDNTPAAYSSCLFGGTGSSLPSTADLTKCPTCPLITTTNLIAVKLDNAVSRAASFVSDELLQLNDETALSLAKEILTFPYPLKTNEVNDYLYQAFEIAKTAYGNILAKANSVPASAIENYKTILNSVTPKLVTEKNYNTAFNIEYAKYDFLRGQKSYPEARKILTNLLCGIYPFDEAYVNYSDKLLTLEQAYSNQDMYDIRLVFDKVKLLELQLKSERLLASEKEISSFFSPAKLTSTKTVSIVNCQTNTPVTSPPMLKTIESTKLEIFPNPSNAHFTFFQNGTTVSKLLIIDLLGKPVKEIILVSENNQSDIEISELTPGMYQVNCLDMNNRSISVKPLVISR